MPFSVPIDPNHIQYQHHLLAQELGTPVVVFENPAYGKSDKLTANQKTALKKEGDFGPVAEPMLGVANSIGVSKVNLMGYSMGGGTSAAMAAHAHEHGIEVESLLVMESPRIVEQAPVTLLRNFIGLGKDLKFTWEHPADPVLREVAKLKPTLPRGTLSYGLAMTKGGLEDDLKTALDNQPNMRLTIASAGESHISPNAANTQVYEDLRKLYPERSVRRIVIPGESHTYADAGERYAQLGKLVLR